MSRRPKTSAIELTRRAFASADDRDFEAMMSFFGPDSVWDVWSWGLGTHSGPRAIRTFFGDWIGGFDDYHVELEELVDLGHEVVFAVATQTARPAGSRGFIQLRHAAIWVWEGEVAMRVTHYQDIEGARVVAAETAKLAAARSEE